jgi:PPOX class probable F420-dependent enzyme
VSRRAQIRMTDAEVAGYLEERRTLHVATRNCDGSTHLVPVFYVLIDGRVAFWTYTRSQKVRNLERDPRITVMVEDGREYAELRGVQIAGAAQLSTDPTALTDFGVRYHARYIGGALDENAREHLAWSARKRTLVVVEPQRIVSWDHRKLDGVY